MASTTATSAFAALKSQTFSVTALSRWSVLNNTLPDPQTITAIHVYDFDNTLFHTPLPNVQLWAGQTIGLLSSNEVLSNGGWWHDNAVLAATGLGAAAEEPRAWSNNWNEKVVDLVRLSMKQSDALTVLLTGRSEQGFAELIKRMVKAKGLEFDMVGLKPKVSPDNEKFPSTMHFKRQFLEQLMFTYLGATELKIYEDRPKHVKGFRDFFAEFNFRMSTPPSGSPRNCARRTPIVAEVVPVAENAKNLESVVEVAEVQRMVNNHNKAVDAGMHNGPRLAIKKTVFFTSYGIEKEDSRKLLKLAEIPSNMASTEIKYHGTNVLICTRPCPRNILNKIGGLGAKMFWRVVSVGHYGQYVWAARLAPRDKDAVYHTDSAVPMVVLAVRKGIRPADANKITEWMVLKKEDQFEFETIVGEKMTLRIEEEDANEDEFESLFPGKGKKKHMVLGGEEDNGGLGHGHGHGHGPRYLGRGEHHGHNGHHGHHHGHHGNHRGGHEGGGFFRGRGGRGRGRGPFRGRGRGRGFHRGGGGGGGGGVE